MLSTGERAYVDADCGSHPLAFGVGNTSKLSTEIALSLFLIGCDCLGNSDWKSVPHIRISKAKCTRDSTANTIASKALVGRVILFMY